MMNFTCTYCEKPINGMTILIDKTHFLHKECEEDYNASIEACIEKNKSKHSPTNKDENSLDCCK